MANNSRIEFTKNTVAANLKELPRVLNTNVYQLMRFHEPKIRAQAKQNAPWTDRTSNARNGLDAKVVVPLRHTYMLVLFHKVPYGIWLEVRFAGRNAIIMPTIRSYAPQVIASFYKLLDRMNIEKGV